MELGDALRRGRDRTAFAALLDDLSNDPETTVVPADQSVFERAVELFNARPDKDWSLTDCTSFVAMQERGLTETLTGVRHFEQARFAKLL